MVAECRAELIVFLFLITVFTKGFNYNLLLRALSQGKYQYHVCENVSKYCSFPITGMMFKLRWRRFIYKNIIGHFVYN